MWMEDMQALERELEAMKLKLDRHECSVCEWKAFVERWLSKVRRALGDRG